MGSHELLFFLFVIAYHYDNKVNRRVNNYTFIPIFLHSVFPFLHISCIFALDFRKRNKQQCKGI